MKPNINELRETASAHDQGHLFTFWDELSDAQGSELLADVAQIDFDLIGHLTKGSNSPAQHGELNVDSVQAADVHPPQPADSEQEKQYLQAYEKGRQMLAEGKVAAMVVAGGQGTRLGFDAPKGTFPIAPISNKTLFQLFAEAILATRRRYHCSLPWLIMTSAATDQATRSFFEQNDFFGLDRSTVHFFSQGAMPAVGSDGRIILSQKHRVALSPDGHGGSIKALHQSGLLQRLINEGVETISYFQVDNPLVSPADPLFLGLHALSGSEMSSLAVPKTDDFEKVGNFAVVDGAVQVIEYSDLPRELALARTADDQRLLNAGSIAVHLLDTIFLSRLTAGDSGIQLPWHRAHKKVPFVDLGSGRRIEPPQPNATKFELFVFDALPLARNPLILEQPRGACFSPVKNAEGVDSAESARRHMIERAADWLERCGVSVPRDDQDHPTATIEISPLRALSVEHLGESLDRDLKIKPGDQIYLE